MTDENPSPTTRIPVPEPPESDTPTAGWPGKTAPVEEAKSDLGATLPPPDTRRALRDEPDRGRTASILFGLVILGIGLWFFAEHTLGIDLPRIRWSQVWPLILIGVGLWVVLGSMRRGSR